MREQGDPGYSDYAQEQVKSNALDRVLLWRLLRYLRPYRALLIIGVILLLVSKVIEAVIPVFIGNVSQTILEYIHADILQRSLILSTIIKYCAFIFGLLLLSYLFDSFNVILKSWVSQKGLFSLRLQVYDHMIRMPVAYFDKHAIGRLMTRTIHDIDQINQMFAESVIPILGNILLFISIFVAIIIIDWKIALIVCTIFPFVFWLTQSFRRNQRRCYDRIRTIVSAMNTFVQEHLMGASTIRNFGLHDKLKNRFEKINEDHCNAYMESIHHFSFFIAGIDFLQSVSLIFAFAMIAFFTSTTAVFEVGAYFTFSLYVLMFFRPLGDLAERYNVLQSAMAAAVRIFNVLDTFTEAVKNTGKLTLKTIDSIRFENVWFAYEKENWVLKGLSFSINKGESCALVGMTGEGKTTIINLLLRFYDIQKGNIKINELDIQEYTLASLRSQFSVVLQDPVLFSGSIAENISLFNPEMDKKQLHATVDYLEMQPLISRFSNGLDHYLSERGKTLSAGEMQLVSLARAVAYQRSALILDEATANIDTKTETIIQKALRKILGDTTALVIAHRLSTIKDVKRIFVIKNGQIVEEGSHESLLAKKGIYEKLYRLHLS